MENGRLLKFERKKETLLDLADKRADSGDLVGALGFLFSALSKSYSYEVLSEIADIYADMGLFDYSNIYWFKYLDIAPRSKKSVAYEELGLNYYYLDNLWAASYYFHLKMEADGYISREGIDDEVLDFLSNTFPKRNFKIVYPKSKADYSGDLKSAKNALVAGNYNLAAEIYSKIPLDVLDEDMCGDVQTAYFLAEKPEQAIKVCKYSLTKHGKNITAYCNLSTVYKMTDDEPKSKYYYKRALACRKGRPSEFFKLATCAIEQQDDKVVRECFEYILKERQYDLNLRFFYGLSLINLREYDEAKKNFAFALQIVPDEIYVRYYFDFVQKLINGDAATEKELPLRYIKDFPFKFVKNYQKLIKEVTENSVSAKSFLTKKENREIIKYGLYSLNGQAAKYSAYILAISDQPFSKQYLLDYLLVPQFPFELKRYVIYALILSGYKEQFGVVGGNVYETIKPKKLVFDDKKDGIAFLSAYANCMSRVAFLGIKNTDKIALNADMVYEKLKDILNNDVQYTSEEIGALILSLCEYDGLSKPSAVTRLFNVKKERLNLLMSEFNKDKSE